MIQIQVALCFYFLVTVSDVFSDESCKLSEKPKLQIVFVVDFALNRDFFPNVQSDIAYNVAKLVKKNFEAEFAVTGFSDYIDELQPRTIDNPEACYFLLQEFTTDENKTRSEIRKDPLKNQDSNSGDNPDRHDSVTTAMLFSAVDKKLLWNEGFYDSRGKLVRKIMIPMVFVGITTKLEKPGHRTIPKADGTDTCSNALIPTFTQLDRVLFEHQFAVVNCIINRDNGKLGLTENIYRQAFGEGLFVPHYEVVFPNPGKIFDPDTNYNYEDFGRQLYEFIAKEVMECEWEDPSAYNTLGL